MHATINIRDEELQLLPKRAVYWPVQQTLIIADVHFGKTGHFRKNGIAMLSEMPFVELENLARLVLEICPKKIIFLGDLFHSEMNNEWGIFEDWLAHQSAKIVLVNGNHDAHLLQHAHLKDLQTIDSLEMEPFIFTHEPLPEKTALYNLAGHIHPGIKLKGRGRQSLRLPAFCFGQDQGLLPAFGLTTGLMIQKMNKQTRYFVSSGEEVFEAKNVMK